MKLIGCEPWGPQDITYCRFMASMRANSEINHIILDLLEGDRNLYNMFNRITTLLLTNP